MGWFDFLRPGRDPRHDAQVRAAVRIDLDTGVLERCPVCGEIVDKLRDDRLHEADRRAAQLIANDDPLVRPFQGDLDRLQRMLREAREPCEFSCRCEAYG